MLTVLGKWLEEKSWFSVIAKAGIVASGRVEAISHTVKQTRYAEQLLELNRMSSCMKSSSIFILLAQN